MQINHFSRLCFLSHTCALLLPPESVIAKPYRDDLNYASLSKEALRKDIVRLKTATINSVHHLDMQYGRIFDYLKQHELLDNHHRYSTWWSWWRIYGTCVFGDITQLLLIKQVRTPLVIYTPNMKPLVSDQMTSHMDVVPTLMPLLGVTKPK